MKIEPEIDPWDLMVEHNQRIQRLERQLQAQAKNIEEMAKAINNGFHLQEINQRTINKLLENEQHVMALIQSILVNKSGT